MSLPRLIVALSTTVLLTGCAGSMPLTPAASALPSSPAHSPAPAPVPAVPAENLPPGTFAGTFLPDGEAAITYNPAVVPAGATARLTIAKTPNGATVRLSVTGMVPRRTYGAHLHTDPCTPTPAAAGPHYQHIHDPAAMASPPAGDPGYANPRNEVWLDFTADAEGVGSAVAAEDWSFDAMSPPRSLIVHAEATRTGTGVAGMAGPRVACLTLAPR